MIEIQKFSPANHYVKATVYGASGSGKTSFGGTAPKPIFASAEAGLLSIRNKDIDFVEIKSLKDLQELATLLEKGGHGYETVVIDSITEINEIIKAQIEEKKGKAMQLQDWGVLGKHIRTTLRRFRDLNMHVLFLAQEILHEAEGEKTRITPSLNGKSATDICYFMDIVGYAHVVEVEKGKMVHKIMTSPHSKLLTKDRTGLIGLDEEPDFSSWVEKIKQINN